MNLQLRPYLPNDAQAWDDFCDDAIQATFLHSRRFLSYHGSRFFDLSLIFEENNTWAGIFPAALHPTVAGCVVSHPGITYGGLLYRTKLKGEKTVLAFEMIRDHYASQGYSRLIYKAVPSIYHQVPAEDDVYAMFRLGARMVRCDLSSSIDLQNRLKVSERRKRGLKKALKGGVEITEGRCFISALWKVLAENLAREHSASPVHNVDEITLLSERFPDNIRVVCGVVNGAVVAGTVLFITPTCMHAQYIASNEQGYALSALDAVFEHCIDMARKEKKRWFDFGISNEDAGLLLNEGLYRFKSEFGGGGVVHEFFELDLSRK